MVAEPGTRAYYLTDFSDEVVPCDCTLAGWAAWLAKGDPVDEIEPARDGQVYGGSAILFHEDIVATWRDGEWSLSREAPSGIQFLAVRNWPGGGWSADDLLAHDVPLREALADWAGSDGECHIAVGTVEDGWRFTFHAGDPPWLEAERAQ